MTLRSAFEDLIGTTLAAVSGVMAKLEYISGLRSRFENLYSHWGLARIHGEGAAQGALAEAHQLLFLKVLRTSLRNLREDVAIASRAADMEPGEYVEQLRGHLPTLLPQEMGGGSERHFSSVLLALSTLTKTAPRAIRRAGPRYLPPAQPRPHPEDGATPAPAPATRDAVAR